LFGKNYLKPLLFDEILTISLYGTEEDLASLERCLELAEAADSETAVLKLAADVRERLQLGLHTACCPRCPSYGSCVHKWLRAERGIRSTCCFRCVGYVTCAEAAKKQKLRRVIVESRIRVEDSEEPIGTFVTTYY